MRITLWWRTGTRGTTYSRCASCVINGRCFWLLLWGSNLPFTITFACRYELVLWVLLLQNVLHMLLFIDTQMTVTAMTLASNMYTYHRIRVFPKAMEKYVHATVSFTPVLPCINPTESPHTSLTPLAQNRLHVIGAGFSACMNPIARMFSWGMGVQMPAGYYTVLAYWLLSSCMQVMLGCFLPTIILAYSHLRDRHKFARANGMLYKRQLRQVMTECVLQHGPVMLAVLTFSLIFFFHQTAAVCD